MLNHSDENHQKQKRAWYQVRLRTVMLAMFLFCIGFAWWSDHARLAKQIRIQSHEIRVFSLSNAQADAVTATLRQLTPESDADPLQIAADERTNSVIAHGSAEKLAAVEALLLRLDK